MTADDPASRPALAAVTVVLLVSLGAVGGGVVAADRAAEDDPADGAAVSAADATRLDAVDRGSAPTQVDGASGGSLADANATIRGQADGDRVGGARATLASAGDVNGDGTEDVLVGVPDNDSLGNDSGAAFLFYGPVESGNLTVGDADAVFLGERRGDWAGYGVAGGDVNDDGFSDVVIGAPRSDRNGTNAGAVYVVYGGPELPEALVLSRADETITGQQRTELAGYAVATVNASAGDAGDDLLVGGPKLGSRRGAAYLLTGSSLSAGSVSAAETTFIGVSDGDLAGRSLSVAGDVDGDGSEDLLIGAPRNDSGAHDAGAAYVVTDTAARGLVSLSASTAALEGMNRYDRAGFAVSTAGDVDGDGYDDVVVGAPYNDRNGGEAGVAYVVSGGPDLNGTTSLALAGVELVGEASGDHAGWAVSSTGTGNASCDAVFVGAPRHDGADVDAGAAYVVSGDRAAERMNGLAASTMNLQSADATFLGEAANDTAGTTVAGLDGAADSEDLFVGAPRSDRGGVNAGAAYLVSDVCPPGESTASATNGSATGTEAPETGTDDGGPNNATVTETPASETVTDTPASETMTGTPASETEIETPANGTVTGASANGTVTETPTNGTETGTRTNETVTETSENETGSDDGTIDVDVSGGESTPTPTPEFGA